MASNGQRIRYDVLRSLAYTGITGTFAAVGTTFTLAPRMIKLKNFTNANLIISYDGINNHDVIYATSAEVDDYGANKAANAQILEQAAGTTIYVKSETSNPTSGTFYVVVVYTSVN